MRCIALLPLLASLACGADDEVVVGGGGDGGDAQSSVPSDGGGSKDAASGAADATVDGGATDAKVDAAPPVVFTGEATYYAADGTGACGFAASPNDLLVAAMNKAQYKRSLCGQCVHVKGPKGEVTVRIVDLCPGCAMGDVDLSEEAFLAISPLSAGRVKIAWSFVACP